MIDRVLKDFQNAQAGFSQEEPEEDKKNEAFEQKQMEFLTGKIVLKDIVGNGGILIAKTGSLINADMIKAAKEQGKLIELIMNCK